MTGPQTINSSLRIVVLGYIVRGPLGGLAWHHLQYVLGLFRLGHDVVFVEDSDDHPSCYDPSRHVTDTDPTYGLAFADRVFRRLGLNDHWAYHDAHSDCWHGPLAEWAAEFCQSADLVLNVSGVNPPRGWWRDVPVRVLIDTDPVFTQVRHLTERPARESSDAHTTFFTYGENIGKPRCTIPNDGFAWQPTRQPICLEAWPVTPGAEHGRWTTVMQWDSYPPRTYAGVHYGMKSESFQRYLHLPTSAGPVFELALGSPNAPREQLRAHGWRLRDPLEITRDPWTYQRYLQQSKAEFAVAKQAYVSTRCGWFSERSAAYLASGRPVLVQDTGFGEWLRADRGVVAFSSPEEALAGIERIDRDYARHCRAARDVAVEYFSADKVLTDLIARALS